MTKLKKQRQPGRAGADKQKHNQQTDTNRNTSNAQTFDIMGVVADLRTEEGRGLVNGVLGHTNDKHFKQIVGMAQALGKRFVIAAGRFDSKGLFSALCDDEDSLRAGFQAANARMDGAGSKTTQWLILPTAVGSMLTAKEVPSC